MIPAAIFDFIGKNDKIFVAIVVAFVTYFLLWLYEEVTDDDDVQRKNWSVVLPGDEKIHRGIEYPEKLVDFIPGRDDVKTIYEIYKFATEKYANNKCYGMRETKDGKLGPYKWITYKEAAEKAKDFSSGLVNLNMIPMYDGMLLLGLFCKNCLEWVIAERACFLQGGATVPLYDTLGSNTIEHIINQTHLSTIFCSRSEFKKLLEVSPKCRYLKNIILKEEPSADEIENAKNSSIRLISFNDVEAEGRKYNFKDHPPKVDDVATFCYTSGTTGTPKGALLSHRNMVASVAGGYVRGIETYPSDVHLSYLPLAHVMERLIQLTLINGGASIGFYSGEVAQITNDLTELRPTVFPSVPRLLNKIYDKIMAGASVSPVKKFLLTTALSQKSKTLKRAGSYEHSIWDRIVFNKLAAKLGLDRCRLIVTGSAPISEEISLFLRVAFSAVLIEGYGQSETSAGCTFTSSGDLSSGHIGTPSPCCEIKLASVSEMEYLNTDTEHELGQNNTIPCLGRGEICIRGPNVFKGYYKMPEKTAETVDQEGWCHTGDIGIWLVSGQLRIVDRLKNIFKLSQGEYVAAEKVENVYSACKYVAQSFVYGDSLQSCVVAIVVPDFEVGEKWAKENKQDSSPESLVENKKFKDAVLKNMNETGRKAKLYGFELAKAIHLSKEPFSIENDLLTPSFKIMRHKAKKTFKKQIDAMYKEI